MAAKYIIIISFVTQMVVSLQLNTPDKTVQPNISDSTGRIKKEEDDGKSSEVGANIGKSSDSFANPQSSSNIFLSPAFSRFLPLSQGAFFPAPAFRQHFPFRRFAQQSGGASGSLLLGATAAPAALVPGGIIFPTGPGGVPLPRPISTGNRSDKCSIKEGVIFYNGKCERLLSDLPCATESQWLIINLQGIPVCTGRPCPREQLFYKGRCVNINDDTACKVGEILYVEFSGTVYCDCEQNFGYDGTAKRCVAEHRQGSCPPGNVLEFKRGQTICVPNSCQSDEFVYYPKDGKCYKKDYVGFCNTSNNLAITYNEKNLTASCLFTVTRNIFEVPALSSCPVGSKRDYLGQCQKVLRFGSESPFSYRVPSQHTSRYSVCPTNYVRYPNGACKKPSSLLGR